MKHKEWIKRNTKNESKHELILRLTLFLLFMIFVILCFRYQFYLLDYRQWGDESETIVAAKMMASGMKLYSEIFNHHGPLTFLPGIITEGLGSYGVQGHRISIAILQVVAVLSIYKTPVIKTSMLRVVAASVSAVVILIFLPEIFGHAYKYQTLAGILLVVVLSQYTLPAILEQEDIKRYRVIVGSVLIASLPFLAINYLPVSGLLFLASWRNKNFKHVLLGSFVGLFLNIVFLWVYGSFSGFLAFHIYLNAEILPLYTGLQPGWQLIVNAVKVVTSDLSNFLSLTVLMLGAFNLAVKEKFFPWRTFLLIVGLCSLLMRGGGFHGMPYFYAMLAMLIPVLATINVKPQTSTYVAIGFLLLFSVKISLVIPGEKQRLLSAPIPRETEFSQLVQEFTKEDDRIIAYTFQNLEYLASDRLPASGHFFYLPWQEKYNESPKFGISIDACKQISEAEPKVMLIDKWTVWDRFSWDSYASCVQNLLDSDYYQVPNMPYYIRKNAFVNFDDYFDRDAVRQMIPTEPLSDSDSIQLRFEQGSKKYDESKLTRIGIMFGTHARVNTGVARLILNRTDGSTLEIDFSLSDLVDNKYKYFELPEGNYFEGEIVSLTGEGVSVWESHTEEGQDFACMKFVYTDEGRGFTPGCPLY